MKTLMIEKVIIDTQLETFEFLTNSATKEEINEATKIFWKFLHLELINLL